VILADTSVWIDHLRSSDARLISELNQANVLMHAFVVGELSLGSFQQRKRVLLDLEQMPKALLARPEEVRELIEQNQLHGKGIGYIDAHLLASVRLMPGVNLWTRDKRLREVANSMKLHVPFL
jgi:predicted nucleic acid-binding protein